MNLSTFAKCIIAIAVSVLLATCRKFDFKFRDPSRHCRIDEFKGIMNKGEVFATPLTRKFHYNEYGNPTFVEYVETTGGTGTPHYYFQYNDSQQLIEMVGYGTHRYFYNSLGQIIIDSSYEYYTGGDARFETRFFYDLYGRVAKTTTKYYYNMFDQEGVGETSTRIFRYDHKGNLIIPGVTYDNKTNISRTHPLWMFLNLNYSVNNPLKATSYNDAGLPLTFGEYFNFLEAAIVFDSVVYDCATADK
jgi:hypothetical protein